MYIFRYFAILFWISFHTYSSIEETIVPTYSDVFLVLGFNGKSHADACAEHNLIPSKNIIESIEWNIESFSNITSILGMQSLNSFGIGGMSSHKLTFM